MRLRFRYDEVLSRVSLDKPIIGAEVGVCQGGMSAALLHAAPSLTLYMVDIRFRGAVENTAFAGERAKIVKCRSPEAAEQFADKFFDFVFIDADHSLEAVEQDIIAWAPKVKDGGLLCGHDYGQDEGVKVAVDAYVKTSGLELELGDDHTWFIRLP
jgi:predicted O-methyltransferase YrrM